MTDEGFNQSNSNLNQRPRVYNLSKKDQFYFLFLTKIAIAGIPKSYFCNEDPKKLLLRIPERRNFR